MWVVSKILKLHSQISLAMKRQHGNISQGVWEEIRVRRVYFLWCESRVCVKLIIICGRKLSLVKAENELIKRQNVEIKEENRQLKALSQRLHADMEKLALNLKEKKGKLRDARLSVGQSTADYNRASFTDKYYDILRRQVFENTSQCCHSLILDAIVVAATDGNVSIITLLVGWIPAASFLLSQYLKALGDLNHHAANVDNQKLLQSTYDKLSDTNKIE
ncbi:hypothetical protein MIR68_012100 [Amoeboaphelidium protococcarum]|nr:hypothetical protein MIR68_012100 [Amoeboaphelidium protococcarum]